MSKSRAVRCPMCGHMSPVSPGRDFLTCTCGLRLRLADSAAESPARSQTLFGILAVASMLIAAVDLIRRLR